MRKKSKGITKAAVPASAANVYNLAVEGSRPTVIESERSWPLRSQDVSPLAWWRRFPSERIRDAEHILLRATLDRITMIRKEPDFSKALRGDPAPAIAAAFALMPIDDVTLEADVTMTAVLRCALDGNAAASLVLAHVVSRVELDHPFATELSASWYAHHLRHSPDRRKFTADERAVWLALRKQDGVHAHPGDPA